MHILLNAVVILKSVDYGHVIVHNSKVDMLDTNFNVTETRAFTGGTSSAMSVTMTLDGQMAVGNVLGVDYWDADGNRDNTLFVPNGGWIWPDVIAVVRFTDDGLYLYAMEYTISSQRWLFKFEVATGDEVWRRQCYSGTSWYTMAVDSDDNPYVARATELLKLSATDGTDLVSYEGMDNWAYDIYIDEDNDRIYTVGYGDGGTPNYQIMASDWGTPGNYAGYSIGTWTKELSSVTVDSDGNVYAVGDRTAFGVGGANASVYKFDSDLNLLASYDTGNSVVYCWWDGDGNLVVKGLSSVDEIYVLDTDLNLLNTYNYNITDFKWNEGIRWQETVTTEAVEGVEEYWTETEISYARLIGETVCILADGVVYPSQVVDDDGNIDDTDFADATNVHIGLNYLSQLKPMKPVTQPDMMKKKVTCKQMGISVHNTDDIEYGVDEDDMKEINFDQSQWKNKCDIDGLFTGSVDVHVPDGFSVDCPLQIQTDAPLPCTVRAMIPKVDTGE
jgi:hypothetical protein